MSEPVRVLYLEDAFDQALLVKTFFKALPDYGLTHIQDGDRAISLVASEEWDLLVTDLNLPGTDGFTVIKKFRERFPARPILVTTGYTRAEYEEQALRAGANMVMIKPLNHAEFVSRVQSMVEGERAPTPSETAAAASERDLESAEMIVAVEGRLGDAEMGCGGSLLEASQDGRSVVIVPVLSDASLATPEELKAATIAADILGAEFRVDRTLFGDLARQRDLLERTLDELRPDAIFMPAPDDRDPSRKSAHELTLAVAREVPIVLGYETATTGLDFVPSTFVDVRKQMVMKMEALAAFQSVGAPRVDLRPRMAQAYARYWGRFMDFTEVEAFERVEVAP